jgi:hypothetical protein
MEQAVTRVLELPVLETARVQAGTVAEPIQLVTLALTCGVLVNDPKRPKTKPATAMAAMSMIAMRMTVGIAI